jgi:uncharacterized protein (TIGR03086 family)
MLTAGELLLLECAIGYALDGVGEVTPERLWQPSPCAGWSLFELLVHLLDVLDIFHDSLADRFLDVDDVPVRPPVGDVVAALRTRAREVLALLSEPEPEPAAGRLAIDDRQLCASVMAQAMCLEITVHAWDVARAVGSARPIPAMLATEALAIAREIIADDIRPDLFGPAVPVPPTASPSDRLVAFLGRRPDAARPDAGS